MKKKWLYIGNYGILAEGDEIEQIEKHCTTAPKDPKKFEHICFHAGLKMINKAKEVVSKDLEKPKRKRRTKAEMEAVKEG